MLISDWSSDVCSSDLLKHGEETLRVQARSDPLTGLMNRDAILGEISARLADPAQSRVAVLYIDLDRFKVVNDVLGHNAGDELLMNAARRIVRAVGTRSEARRVGKEWVRTGRTRGVPSH